MASPPEPAAPRAAPVPPPKGSDQIWDLLFQSNLAVAFGKKTIKAQLSEFFDQAQSILAG